ncbi:C4-dicarboxylate ABC transporter substrate-binding protein [Glutamicibacter uratoxydans]|uniref:C4-dicarboxylate ABC transporter substrate-binding protein n=1 Tax=Glutamicibacter uratoxydans TaxID=43667 RepID=A0A4Y4DQC8_GLUUR|nr:TAXI family TRAP transporter solute-binding subunit [Glutamicibacter uratoxydans]GED04761.1 C4-dicarboxylate ABC transporter substrate-binding protein [Glutamicibacter uratoxydans]
MSSSKLSRRTVLKWSLGLPLAVAAPVAFGGCSAHSADELNIAAGEEGGVYFEFATLLSLALVRHGIAKTSRAIATEASVQNLNMLASGDAQLSLALADTVAQYRQDGHGSKPVALGRVYQNYFHCISRAESRIFTLDDLAGRRIGTGAAGSGTWVTGQRILKAAGLPTAARPPEEVKLGYADGLEALKSGDIDALFLFGGMPVRGVAELARHVDLRLMNLNDVLQSLRRSYPGLYDHVTIPGGTYPRVPEASSIGVANLLMASESLDEDLVGRIVRMLVEHAQELIPEQTAGMQFLSPQSLISTAGQPLHPGARTAYRQLHG